MRLEFADRSLRERSVNVALAERSWGVPVARKYVVRLSQLKSAPSRADLMALRALRLHPLRGGREGQWAIDLHSRWRLVVSFDADTVIIEEVSNHYGD